MVLASFHPPLGRRPWLGAAVAVGGTAVLAGALLPFRDHLDNATSGLAFLVPLTVGTALGGVPAALGGVLVGFVAYNALFTLPYGTLAVAHVPDVVGLVVYSVVGALTAVIVSLHQREVEAARRREVEAVTLSDMSRSLISGVELEEVLRPMVRRSRQLFGLRAALVVLPAGYLPDEFVVAEGDPLTWRLHEGGPRFDDDDARVMPLRIDDSVIGWFVAAGLVGPAELRVLQGFADQAALAVNRTSLVEDATRVQALEQADELRSALMRSVSHDLRTPLASITAAAEDLADPDLPLGSEDRQVLAITIAEESRRLDKLVGELLDVSRIESGRLEVHPQVVDLADLIESAIAGRVQEQVQIEVGRDELLVHADPVLIGQVLQNLIDNAVRFSPSGQRPVVTARRGDDAVEIAVSDRGPGVLRAERDHIFELFYSPTDGEGSRASGVGLAICEAFVAAHDGRIWVQDTPGGGATFVFTLPLAAAPPEEPIGQPHV